MQKRKCGKNLERNWEEWQSAKEQKSLEWNMTRTENAGRFCRVTSKLINKSSFTKLWGMKDRKWKIQIEESGREETAEVIRAIKIRKARGENDVKCELWKIYEARCGDPETPKKRQTFSICRCLFALELFSSYFKKASLNCITERLWSMCVVAKERVTSVRCKNEKSIVRSLESLADTGTSSNPELLPLNHSDWYGGFEEVIYGGSVLYGIAIASNRLRFT